VENLYLGTGILTGFLFEGRYINTRFKTEFLYLLESTNLYPNIIYIESFSILVLKVFI